MRKVFLVFLSLVLFSVQCQGAVLTKVSDIVQHPFSYIGKRLVYLRGTNLGRDLTSENGIAGYQCRDCWILKDETGELWVTGWHTVKDDKNCRVKALVVLEPVDDGLDEWEVKLLSYITERCPVQEKAEEMEDHGVFEREDQDQGMLSKRGRHFMFFERKRPADYW